MAGTDPSSDHANEKRHGMDELYLFGLFYHLDIGSIW